MIANGVGSGVVAAYVAMSVRVLVHKLPGFVENQLGSPSARAVRSEPAMKALISSRFVHQISADLDDS